MFSIKNKFILLFFLYPSMVVAENLQYLISEAVNTNPLVMGGVAQARSAEVGIETARWQFFPTPSINIQTAVASDSDPQFQGDDWVATASLSQPLWTGGRLTSGLNSARATYNASHASVEEIRQQIALQVVQAYGDWLSAKLKHQALKTSISNHELLRSLVQRRVIKGISNQSDLDLAEGRLESTRAHAVATYAQQAIALLHLNQLVGRELRSDQLFHKEPRPLSFGLLELQQQALSINPSLLHAEAQLALADAELSTAKADRWPEISLRMEYQDGNFDIADTDAEFRVFIGLNSRFGAGLSSLSSVKESSYQRHAAQAEINAQRLFVNQQVSADYARLSSFQQRLIALQASVSTAKRVSISYDRQFLAGRKTWLDVMNSARDLVGVEVQLADAEAATLVVSWRLLLFSQGLPAFAGQST
jgi:adhesin transport system outer membrane protein